MILNKRKVQTLTKDLPKYFEQLLKISKNLADIKNGDLDKTKLINKITKISNMVDKLEIEIDEKYLKTEQEETPNKRKGGFDKIVSITPEFQQFLQLDEPKINRQDVTVALNVRCHINEEKQTEKHLRWHHLNPEKRDLRKPDDKRVILIEKDPELSKLLNYPKYKNDVENGKVFKEYTLEKYNHKINMERESNKKNDISTEIEFYENGKCYIRRCGKRYNVVDVVVGGKPKKRLIETDPTIMLCTLQKLITPHILSDKIEDKDKGESVTTEHIVLPEPEIIEEEDIITVKEEDITVTKKGVEEKIEKKDVKKENKNKSSKR